MTQLDLFGETHQQAFDAWVHTPAGGAVADRFIRLAIGLRRCGKFRKFGAKAICERLRWYYMMRRVENDYAINNNHTAYLARFAMERAAELRGFFATRETGRPEKRTKVIIVKGAA